MKLYQKYLVLLIIVLIFLSAYFYKKNEQGYINRVHTVLLNLLNKQIENEKAKAFNFAFSLSQNETLKSSIQNNKPQQGYMILQEYMRTFENFSGFKIHAQILTKDYVIFARSWDNRDAGLSVKKYRPDLQEIKKNKHPHISFEAARKLVLIASIPIVGKNDNVIGFIEVIRRFQSLEKYFRNYDIDMMVLLDTKYEKQAVLLKNNPRIQNMIVANDGANVEHIKKLQQMGLSQLLQQGQLNGDKHYYFSRAIFNNNHEVIGYFILIISKKKLKLFRAFESDLDNVFTYARKDLYNLMIKNSDTSQKHSCLQNLQQRTKSTTIVRGKIK